jgi:hypothetical protein
MSDGANVADAGRTLGAADLQVIEGTAREPARAPCPACGRPIAAGQEVATSLGDVRRGAIGVTVHRRCFAAIGRPGLLELMIAAYQRAASR